MCILIYAAPGQLIPHDHLVEACKQNPDGFGWAVIDDTNRLIIDKSMTADDVIRSFELIRAQYPERPALFHARIATHGTVNLDNCHPFWVDGETVLAHNGIINIETDGKRSDTKTFAEDWLPELGTHSLDDPDFVVELEKFLGGSKVVVLSTAPHLNQWAYILNEEYGDWEEGVWYSNTSYQPRKYTPYRMYDSWGGWEGHFNDRREWTGYSQGVLELTTGDRQYSTWDTLKCSFCEQEFIVPEGELECPNCEMCVKCDRWACICYLDDAEDEATLDLMLDNWIEMCDHYVDAGGGLHILDPRTRRWRDAFEEEIDEYEQYFGREPIASIQSQLDNF